ncbi:MAG TPA: GNAT family N-acetyltransferase [Dongiaceae bacterium]|nr:GNAT family N-acetyltransferase [Dongiaceae bacterium]
MNASPTWHEEPIAKHHDRNGFDCGSPELNLYLAKFARQNHDAGGAKTFVAVGSPGGTTILGFYSISPGAIEFGRVPAKLTKKLGRYDVPVFRLARLAVDRTSQNRGLGAELLGAAGARALAVAMEVGGVALAIDAKDQRAAEWYIRFGALPLLDDPMKLVLPLQVIANELATIRSTKAP